MIDFFSKIKITRSDSILISKIAKRAIHFYRSDYRSCMMDLECVHNENPLRLNDLLNANGFDFAHDLCGIENNLDRENGKLLNYFSPRYTK